jgi:hypothetical protein
LVPGWTSWHLGKAHCLVYPRTVTLATLTNVDRSVIVIIVFLSLAATVIFVRLYTRARERGNEGQAKLSMLERIEAMSDEEYAAWREEGRRQREANKKPPRP